MPKSSNKKTSNQNYFLDNRLSINFEQHSVKGETYFDPRFIH